MPAINSPTPDATTTSKGKVQLAGDLGGTAASPTAKVNGFTASSTPTASTILPLDSNGKLQAPAVNYLGFVSTSTSQSSISSTQIDLNSMSLTFTVPSGVNTLVFELGVSLWSSTAAGDQWAFYLVDGTTTLRRWTAVNSGTFGYGVFAKYYLPSPTSGSHTYKIQVARTNGSGSGSTNADTQNLVTFMAYILN